MDKMDGYGHFFIRSVNSFSLMLTLGIESTCDETAASVVRNGNDILSNVVASQIDMHAIYGGVVPELACRKHVDVIIPVIDEALSKAGVSLEAIDLFAVAHGPGLIGALLIGLNAAKSLAMALNKPFIGVNHIEAHLYAALMSHATPASFPCLGVVLSGGHTSLMHMQDANRYTLIGHTVDDAIGEAFDKVGKLLDLPYPAGPLIEQLAQKGDPHSYPFKSGKVKGQPYNFSFSGLKTAVLYALRGQNRHTPLSDLSYQDKCNVSAAFQQAAFTDILQKTVAAAEQFNCRTLLFGGGVTNNQRLRHLFAEQAPHLTCLWPSVGLSLDNAAMIAGLGYHLFKERGHGDSLDLQAITRF
jgi:N6-L-threonylcarbamoyladenine synthase